MFVGGDWGRTKMGISIMNTAEAAKIVNIKVSPQTHPIKVTKMLDMYTIGYGHIKKGTDTTFYIDVCELPSSNIQQVKVNSSCGCTVVKVKKEGNCNKVRVKYDSKRMGSFKKSIGVSLKVDGKIETIFFKLIGKVIS